MTAKRLRSISPDLSPTSAHLPLERLYPQAGPAPRTRTKAKARLTQGESPGTEPEPEKRLKLYKRACPKATQDRVDRVLTQRFFCVGRMRTTETSEEFKVLGSTGNVYTIQICHVPTCDCPDGQKGNHCKHILFVFLKILQIPQSVNLWYQSALLTEELQAIFANARPAPQSQQEERVKKLYRIATGQEEPEVDEQGQAIDPAGVHKRIPKEDDSCPICYEDFEPGSEAGLVFCLSPRGCGNALHSMCFQNWARTSNPVTCPLCREKWSETSSGPPTAQGSSSAAGPSYSSEGYLNFAHSAGISPERDTSTYYHGPRRKRDRRSARADRRDWNRFDRYVPDDFYGDPVLYDLWCLEQGW